MQLVQISKPTPSAKTPPRTSPRPTNGFRHLPVELFETPRRCFAFDARNVQFVEIDRVALDLLRILRDEEQTIDELVSRLPQHAPDIVREAYRDLLEAQTSGFLAPYDFRRVPKYDDRSFEDKLSRSMSGMTISITTQCNLSCSYCIYGGQYERFDKLSNRPMTWDTLKNALDFLRAHSGESDSLKLDFFGGEPLMAFPLIERGVEYLDSILGPDGPKIYVTITTNGTILSDRILDFLIERDVYVQFSVDGNKEIHDRNRPYRKTGRGSFDRVLENLQRIHDRDPDYYRKNMRIKAVISTETLDIDAEQFYQHPIIQILIEEGHHSFLNTEPNYEVSMDGDYVERINRIAERLRNVVGAATLEELTAGLNRQQRDLFSRTLGDFFDVQVVNAVYLANLDRLPFRKGCLMGIAEGHVGPSGDITVCHKASQGADFVIGNVNEGRWHFDKIHALNRRLHQWGDCSSCFAQRFCDLCYEKLDGAPGELNTSRLSFCDFTRQRYRLIFDYMLRVLDRNPLLWNEIDRLIDEKADALEREQRDAAQHG